MLRDMAGQLYDLSKDMRHRVGRVVGPGEKIVWVGRPNWRATWGQLLAILLFGLFWSAISFPMGVMAVVGATGLVPIKLNGSLVWPLWAKIGIPLFMAPFVAIGVALLCAPFVAIWRSIRTIHVVTDRRIVDIMPHEVVSVDAAALSSVRRKPRQDGFGTLVIGLGWTKDGEGDTVEKLNEWSGVPAAERAERYIREMIARRPTPA